MWIFFVYYTIVHLIYKQITNNPKSKNDTKTGRNQNSSLLPLVNSKLIAKYFVK